MSNFFSVTGFEKNETVAEVLASTLDSNLG